MFFSSSLCWAPLGALSDGGRNKGTAYTLLDYTNVQERDTSHLVLDKIYIARNQERQLQIQALTRHYTVLGYRYSEADGQTDMAPT